MLLALAIVALCLAVFAPGASASVAPTLTLDQSAGTQAGATQALGMDMQFNPSSGDSPQDLTITLPSGLLASAAVDGGQCIKALDVSGSTCAIGTGTAVTTVQTASGPLQVNADLTFYLVPPPAPGDLAGLYISGSSLGAPLGQIGSTGAITIRPTGSADGVGLNIALTIPNSLGDLPVQIDEIDSTFNALRYPATCPSTPANVSIAVNSYSSATLESSSAPLTVTGCGALPFAPKLSTTFTKDSGDDEVKIAANITQSASEAPNASMSLVFPKSTLLPNPVAAQHLCANIASGTCTPVGSATAVSPLYPAPLTATAYLTGKLTDLQLTLVFPAPFPLTLVGTVSLATDTTSFSGIPDFPLTALAVDLNGGPYAPFLVNCSDPSGTASASFVSQTGSKATGSSAVSVTGCSASKKKSSKKVGKPRFIGGHFAALRGTAPRLTGIMVAGRNAPALKKVTITLPKGFSATKAGLRKSIKIRHAKLASASLSHGRIVLKLKGTARRVSITITLHDTAATRSKARHHKLHRLKVKFAMANAKGKTTNVSATIRRLGL